MKHFITTIFLFSTFFSISQEKVAFGISGTYNYPLNGIGVGIRSQIPILANLAIVPQVKYNPS